MPEETIAENGTPKATGPAKTMKIKLVRSPICTPMKHKIIVRSLGLKKIDQVVVRPDDACFNGMVNKIPHLLEVVK